VIADKVKFVIRKVVDDTAEHVLKPEQQQSHPTTNISTLKKNTLLRKFSLIVSCLAELLKGFVKFQVRLEIPLRKESKKRHFTTVLLISLFSVFM